MVSMTTIAATRIGFWPSNVGRCMILTLGCHRDQYISSNRAVFFKSKKLLIKPTIIACVDISISVITGSLLDIISRIPSLPQSKDCMSPVRFVKLSRKGKAGVEGSRRVKNSFQLVFARSRYSMSVSFGYVQTKFRCKHVEQGRIKSQALFNLTQLSHDFLFAGLSSTPHVLRCLVSASFREKVRKH